MILITTFTRFIFTQPQAPVLIGEAAIAIDAQTGEILYAKDIDRQMYPASITKLLTAILLAEHKDKQDILLYSELAAEIPASKFYVDAGQEFFARDAMSGLLLYSANDVAFMIGENIAGSEAGFAEMMNQKCAELKMTHTHFMNAHGLHDDNHYSTAYDLSILLRAIRNYPWIMECTAQKEATLHTLAGIRVEIKNKNKLLQINGCIAGKTGWTTEAGRSLAALYERAGRVIGAVVLKSDYNDGDSAVFKDMDKLADWAYTVQPSAVFTEGEIVKNIHMEYKLIPFLGPIRELALQIITKQPIFEYTADPSMQMDIHINKINIWQLNKQRSIGKLIIKGHEILHEYPLYPMLSTWDLIQKEGQFYIVLVLLTFMAVLLILFIHKQIIKINKFKEAE